MQIQAADYPLQVEPAQVLGFDCGLGAGLRICIFFGNKTHVVAKSALRPHFYIFISAAKTPSACSLAPPFQMGAAALGSQLTYGLRPFGPMFFPMGD